MASSLTMVYDIIARDRASAVFTRTGTAAESSASRIGALGKALGVFLAIDIGAHAVKMAADFQKSTNVFVTAAGETTANLKTVREGILNIATGTGAPIKGLTDAMYIIEKAGIRGADGLKVLRAAAQGAAEENANLATVTTAMTSIMQSYHLSAGDSVSVMNELKAAAGESKTTMEQFAGSLSTVLPVASANHIAFADVAGALATLTQHGTTADEATQELSNTIRNLAAPNMVASKEMAQLGITSTDVSQQLGSRGLTGTLEFLSETVLKKMGPSGLVLLDTFNQSKVAAADAQREFGALSPAAQKLAKDFEDSKIGLKDYRVAARSLGGEQGALALQFLTTYTNAHGFQQAIKNGVPGAQTYTDAIKKMTGGANGLNTTLQITGENLAGTEARTKAISAAAQNAGKDVSGWASTQSLMSTKTAEFRDQIDVLGIRIGTALLPAVGAVVGVLANGVGVVQRNVSTYAPLIKAVGLVAAGYYGVAFASKIYEAASIRVIAMTDALKASWAASGGTVGGFTGSVAAGAAKLGLYVAAAAFVVGTVRSIGDSSKYAQQQVANFTSKIDPQYPDTYGRAIDGMTQKLKSTQQVGSGLRTVLNTMLGGLTGPTAAQVGKAQDALRTSIANTAVAAANQKENVLNLMQEYHLSDPEVRALAKSLGIDLGGNLYAVTTRFRAMNGQISDFINLKAGTVTSLADFNSGLLHLKDNLAANVHDWSLNTDAGIKNNKAVADLVTQYGRYHDNLIQTQGDTPATAFALARLRNHFADLLTQVTGNRQQAESLLDKMGLIPPSITTHWNEPGLQSAVAAAGSLLEVLQKLPPQKDITVNFHQAVTGPLGQFGAFNSRSGVGAGGIGNDPLLGPGHASGGLITGPGGPRDDRIPSLLSNGEFVVNAAATSQHRSLLEAINGTSGGSTGRFATGGPVTGSPTTVADFKLSSVKPDKKVFDDLFKMPVEAQKRNQTSINKATKAAFVDPQADALDKSSKAAAGFADAMPKDFVKRIDSHRGDVLKTQTATFFDTADLTLNRTGDRAHGFADAMPKDFAKTVLSHTGDLQTAYKVSAGDTWQRTTDGMNDLADRTGKSVPAKIVAGFNNAVGAVKAAADKLLSLIQKPIDLLHGKTIQIVANTSITGVVTAATGGYIAGPGGPKDDAIPAMLSNGEFVMNAAATKKHLPLLHHLNKAQHFADGGLVTPEFSLTGAAPKIAASLDKMMAIATDKLSAEAQKRSDAFASTFYNFSGPPGSSFQDIIAVMAKSGLPFLINSTTGGGHAPGSYHYRGMAVDFGAAGNNPAILGQIARYWDKYGGSLLEEIYSGDGGHFIKDGRHVPASFYASVLAEHFSHVHIAATDAAMQRILGVSSGGGGATQWTGLVHRVLGELGLSQALTAKVLSQIGSESGGVSGILQQVHDINSGGNEALGLLQLTPGTFDAYAGPYRGLGRANPLANIFAGVNYEAHKYGGNPTLRDFGQGHGYANGGMPPIGRPFWVGENGPEQMKLGAGGATVVSTERSHRMAGGGGGFHVHGDMIVQSDVDFEVKLRQSEFRQQTANGFG